MDNPAEAPVPAHKPIREANTMPPSAHDNTSDICADEGRSDEVHNDTASHASESKASQTSTTKRFCTFAVSTGLTDSPGMRPKLRLRVYQAAFPEMDRTIVDEKPVKVEDEQHVFIGIFKCRDHCSLIWCRNCCFRYRMNSNNRLREAFTSNFARDPTTRVELLTEYLRQVRIYKEIEEHTDDKKPTSTFGGFSPYLLYQVWLAK